jgi:hypothetical protein
MHLQVEYSTIIHYSLTSLQFTKLVLAYLSATIVMSRGEYVWTMGLEAAAAY